MLCLPLHCLRDSVVGSMFSGQRPFLFFGNGRTPHLLRNFFALPAPCPLSPNIRDLYNEVPPRKSFWWMVDWWSVRSSRTCDLWLRCFDLLLLYMINMLQTSTFTSLLKNFINISLIIFFPLYMGEQLDLFNPCHPLLGCTACYILVL